MLVEVSIPTLDPPTGAELAVEWLTRSRDHVIIVPSSGTAIGSEPLREVRQKLHVPPGSHMLVAFLKLHRLNIYDDVFTYR